MASSLSGQIEHQIAIKGMKLSSCIKELRPWVTMLNIFTSPKISYMVPLTNNMKEIFIIHSMKLVTVKRVWA